MFTQPSNMELRGDSDPQLGVILARFFTKDVVSFGSLLRKSTNLLIALAKHTKCKWVMSCAVNNQKLQLRSILYCVHNGVLQRIDIVNDYTSRSQFTSALNLATQFFAHDRLVKFPVWVLSSDILTTTGRYIYSKYRFKADDGREVLFKCTIEPQPLTFAHRWKILKHLFHRHQDFVEQRLLIALEDSSPNPEIALQPLLTTRMAG